MTGNEPSDWAAAGLFVWLFGLADVALTLLARICIPPDGHWLVRPWAFRLMVGYAVFCLVVGFLMLAYASR